MAYRIVLTGGPSAGKTTLLALLTKKYGSAVGIAPEAATILFRGGFPRPVTFEDRIHTQRSIFALQRELEMAAQEKITTGAIFCDRGSLDGGAYYEGGSLKEFCFAMGSSVERELDRYSTVIHLQTAPANCGYTNTEVRTETAEEAAALDRRLGEIWSQHPRYVFVPNRGTFIQKLDDALIALKPYMPHEDDVLYRYATAADLIF